MNDICRDVERIYDENSAGKIVFKGFKTKCLFGLFFIPIIFVISFMFLRNDLGGTMTMLASIVYVPFIFYIFVNPHIKKKLKKLDIDPDESIWKYWDNKAYYNYRNNKFLNGLIESNILIKGSFEFNTSRLKELSDYFAFAFKKIDPIENMKIFGALLLAFTIPIWNQFLNVIGKLLLNSEMDVGSIIDYNVKYSFILLMVIVTILFTVCLFRTVLKDLFEGKKRKYSQISSYLLNVKWNEEVKLHSEKSTLKSNKIDQDEENIMFADPIIL